MVQLVGSVCSLMAFATGICHYAFISYFKTFSILCPFFRYMFFLNLVSINQTERSTIPAYPSVFFPFFFLFFFFLSF